MKQLTVQVARVERCSPLWVGRRLLEQLPALVEPARYSSIVVVADDGAQSAVSRILAALSLPESRALLLPGGERMKDTAGLEALWRFFVEQKLDRRSLVVTAGGGALSDLAGFAAATYMRGIPFLHVPTTLLAQVDASIGGKTGINFMGVKNLLGSIMQPVGIVVDVDTLATLPAREVRSGFAEILKHGLIADAAYFDRVSSRDCSEWSADELVEIIFRSCEIKKAVVEADETEQGLRKTLNFGHSIGHAAESYALDHGVSLTHGEAVAIGMVGESFVSWKSGLISEQCFLRARDGIARAGLPVSLPAAMPPAALRALMARDKKNVGSEVRLALLEAVGRSVFDRTVGEPLLTAALELIQPGAGRYA